ncbi:MAG: dienelactone hydrolase family protein [Candidatus Sulfotelmatobacter sp.]
MDDDPVTAVRKIKAPVLFLYGGSDPWVPVAQSLEQLRILANDHPKIAYAVVPDVGHEMMFRAKDTMEFDAKSLSEAYPQSPEYFMVLGSWLSRVVTR